MTSIISIPVSIGEVFDKLTILEIKEKKLSAGREYVKKEIELLSKIAAPFASSAASYHKNVLRLINAEIWQLQDQFRIEMNEEKQSKLSKEIISLNDSRFRVKSKLDRLFESEIREQKGYSQKKAFFLGHLGMGDQINQIPIVRYLASRFDTTKVVCKQQHLATLKIAFSDDPSIEFYPVVSDKEISPHFGFPRAAFETITRGYKVFTCGAHSISREKSRFARKIGFGQRLDTSDLPFNFYKDLDFPPSTFVDYHFIADSEESGRLYNLVKDKRFVVCHSSVSTGPAFDISEVGKILKSDSNEIIVLDINYNYYPKQHPYNSLAEEFVNKPLPHYKETIIHAEDLILTDSSLFCLAIGLPLRCNHIYYTSRCGQDYDHIEKYLLQARHEWHSRFVKINGLLPSGKTRLEC